MKNFVGRLALVLKAESDSARRRRHQDPHHRPGSLHYLSISSRRPMASPLPSLKSEGCFEGERKIVEMRRREAN